MNAKVVYLDTSAFLKLIVAESQSFQLRKRLLNFPTRTSATLLKTETIRALRRSRNDHLIRKANRLFTSIHFIRLDDPLLEAAGHIDPVELRSLDAIHLGAALAVGMDLGAIFTYDARLKKAALLRGFKVESPGES